MNKMPFMKFYTADWLKGTRGLTNREKGIWVDLLIYMWESPERGQISGTWEDLSRMVGEPWLEGETIIQGMARKGLLEINECNGVTQTLRPVTLKCRRMAKEENDRNSNALRQKKYRNIQSNEEVTREKSEVRSQKTDNDLYISPSKRFVKPTPQEVEGYANSIDFRVSGEAFVSFYEASGWMRGRTPIKDWKACVRTWKVKKEQEGGVSEKRKFKLIEGITVYDSRKDRVPN